VATRVPGLKKYATINKNATATSGTTIAAGFAFIPTAELSPREGDASAVVLVSVCEVLVAVVHASEVMYESKFLLSTKST
jgi:hypothetical protein